ncbi:diguanylate cyclase domain-containing protein [Mesorhizobium abyssinicae]|uniref:diguanylate cyclase domain-containing protein n=1 Tax=Mesorhizobium abyssinicae TaxID=1209958 RepID=UPI00387DD018
MLLPRVTEEERAPWPNAFERALSPQPFPTRAAARAALLSVGVAMQAADEAISPEQLQRHADTALYLAKERGRNRIVLRRPDSEECKPVRWAQ